MRITTVLAAAVAFGTLAACGESAEEERAENIVENAEMEAENIMETAENRAENVMETAENRAENITDEGADGPAMAEDAAQNSN